jgi:hypothetical protein
MSAIGSYVVMRRSDLPGCIALAQNIRTETTGKWIFKQTQEVGHDEFYRAWKAGVVREADFEYSGYALGNYLDAQEAVNGAQLFDEQSETGQVLAKVFTAAFVFDAPVSLPAMAGEPLLEFCREEYGADAQGMAEAITAADEFYRRGLAEITPEHLVVFVIS